MNTVLLAVILIPIVEIYLFIKIGSQIGAFTTIFLVFFTAVVGVYYARYEGINTLRSGITQIIKNLYIISKKAVNQFYKKLKYYNINRLYNIL